MREKRIAIASLASVIWLDNPRVMVLEQFTSEYECECKALIAAAQNQMQYSRVLDPTLGEFVFHAECTARGTHSEH